LHILSIAEKNPRGQDLYWTQQYIHKSFTINKSMNTYETHTCVLCNIGQQKRVLG